MSFRVIGLIGFAGAGKDEAAKAITSQGYARVSLADPVREALLALDPCLGIVAGALHRLSEIVRVYGWQGAKQYPEVRRLLRRMGTEAGREIHGQECWVDLARSRAIAARRDKAQGVVVTDIRFANELVLLDMIPAEEKPLLVHIHRPGVGSVNEHKSEQLEQLFRFANCVIVNDGTVEELHAKVLEACGLEAVPA